VSTPPAPPKTIGEARDEWLRHITVDRDRRPSTVRDYRGRSRRYIVDVFGADTPLEALTTERIEAWQQELIESGRLSRRTIQKAQVMLHAILKPQGRRGQDHEHLPRRHFLATHLKLRVVASTATRTSARWRGCRPTSAGQADRWRISLKTRTG
jgi:integrase family protein with SAM-like domain